jgi:uncharacterized membrane protein YuzA (DUF378 family)
VTYALTVLIYALVGLTPLAMIVLLALILRELRRR